MGCGTERRPAPPGRSEPVAHHRCPNRRILAYRGSVPHKSVSPTIPQLQALPHGARVLAATRAARSVLLLYASWESCDLRAAAAIRDLLTVAERSLAMSVPPPKPEQIEFARSVAAKAADAALLARVDARESGSSRSDRISADAETRAASDACDAAIYAAEAASCGTANSAAYAAWSLRAADQAVCSTARSLPPKDRTKFRARWRAAFAKDLRTLGRLAAERGWVDDADPTLPGPLPGA